MSKELKERVEQLETQVADLSERLTALEDDSEPTEDDDDESEEESTAAAPEPLEKGDEET